jgi:hypothetical protein
MISMMAVSISSWRTDCSLGQARCLRDPHPGLCSPRVDETDYIRRVQEEIDALREALAFAFEASR